MDKLININLRRAEIPNGEEIVDRKGYVRFGHNNDYPAVLRDYADRCVELRAIINGLADYIAGNGFVDESDRTIDRHGTALSELVHSIADDYANLGAFCLHIIRNRGGAISDLERILPEHIRLNEDGTSAYYSTDFSKRGNVKLYPIFDSDKRQSSSIFYYASPRSRGVYGLPMWNSAISSVQTAIEIDRFHLSSILNDFMPSAIVKMYGDMPDDETKSKFYHELNDRFSGSENAARLMVIFGQDRDHTCDIERLNEDGFDERYQALAKSTREKIFMAFRATPQLFGLDPERSTFNSVEYKQSFKLFNETIVNPMQREIEKAFAKIGFHFELKSFNINFESNESTIN